VDAPRGRNESLVGHDAGRRVGRMAMEMAREYLDQEVYFAGLIDLLQSLPA
jgi:hypothetical protein